MYDAKHHRYTLDVLGHAAALLRQTDWDWPVAFRDSVGTTWTVHGQSQLEDLRDDGDGWPREVIRQAGKYSRHAAAERSDIAQTVLAAREWYGTGDVEGPAIALLEDAEAAETQLIAGRGIPILAETRAVLAWHMVMPRGQDQEMRLSLLRDEYHVPYSARAIGWSPILALPLQGWAHSGTYPPAILRPSR